MDCRGSSDRGDCIAGIMSLYDYKSIEQVEREQKAKALSLLPPGKPGIFQKILSPEFYPVIAGAGLFLTIGVIISRKRKKKK